MAARVGACSAVQSWIEAGRGKSSGLRPCALGGAEAGVAAARALTPGEVVYEVPRALWLTVGALNSSAAGRAALKWAKRASIGPEEAHLELCLLALALLLQRSAAGRSSWATWIASLPWGEGVAHLPLTWAEERLEEQLRGAAPQPAVGDKRRQLAAAYRSLVASCKDPAALSELGAACPGPKDLIDAFALVHSRAMDVGPLHEACPSLAGGRGRMALVPLADMLNHSPEPNLEWDVQGDRLVGRATDAVPEGGELFIRYRGAASPQAFFATYGFVEQGSCTVPAELQPPWLLPQGGRWPAVRPCSGASVRRLLSRLRVAAASAEERSRLEASGLPPEDAARLPLSLRSERAALEELRSRLAARAGGGAGGAAEVPPATPAVAALRGAEEAGWRRLDEFAAGLLAELGGAGGLESFEAPGGACRVAVLVHRAMRALAGAGAADDEYFAAGIVELRDAGGVKGRGYYAREDTGAGTLLLAEQPLVLDAGEDDFCGVAAAIVLGLRGEAELRPAPGDGGSSAGDAEQAARWLGAVDGAGAEAAARALAAARNNGFSTSLEGAGEEEQPMLLFQRLCIFNHSCAPNCAVYRDEATGFTHVLVIRPVKRGAEFMIHYLDELFLLPTSLRQSFLQGRFGFECACPRCEGWDEASCAVEALLNRTADFPHGEAAGRLHAMRRAHASLCHVEKEGGLPVGFAFRTFEHWAQALAAADAALSDIAQYGAPTFWARHHARSLRCLALEGLQKDTLAYLALAEHADAAHRLLPPFCGALRQLQMRLASLRARLPKALAQRVEEKAQQQHGARLRALEGDVATLERWLREARATAAAAARPARAAEGAEEAQAAAAAAAEEAAKRQAEAAAATADATRRAEAREAQGAASRAALRARLERARGERGRLQEAVAVREAALQAAREALARERAQLDEKTAEVDALEAEAAGTCPDVAEAGA